MKAFLVLGIVFLVIVSCERDFVFRGGGEGLSFSDDTVMFDTIFTTIGSTTKRLRVYNPYSEDMIVDAISLAGGEKSNFRININGYEQSELANVRLRSRDSMFIFVEVTVDRGDVNTPFIVSDSIMFYTDSKIQKVNLIAYGQDFVLLRKKTLKTQTFTNDKPYLVYDYLVVDSFQTLTIEPGTHIHFYNDASFLVLGSLVCQGTLANPIVFSGSRLETDYKDVPGQWGYVRFYPGSKNNVLDYTNIRNGLMGIWADSVGIGNDAPLIISNSKIEHVSSIGLLAENSKIVASNSLFGDCGRHSVALTVGGFYEFYHCTLANYDFDYVSRNTPALLLNNYYVDSKSNVTHIIPLQKALFANCIVYGKISSEIGFDFKIPDGDKTGLTTNYLFDHSVIKIDSKTVASESSRFKDVIVNKDPKFKSYKKYDYQLDTLSVAKDAGLVSYGILYPKDYSGVSRIKDTDIGPDVGMFERLEK